MWVKGNFECSKPPTVRSNHPELYVPIAILVATAVLAWPVVSSAQVRTPYSPGFAATYSGTLPDSGFTYMNFFQRYAFNQVKGSNGERLPVSGNLTVTIDHNLFIWTSTKKILGARFALLADLPVVDTSLRSEDFGNVAAGSGFADSFYQPITLGWTLSRADIMAGYGFTPPTGRFEPEVPVNVNSGFWTHFPFAGQTVYLTKDKNTVASAYETYEFHTKQKGTNIRLGQNIDIDYSVMQTISFQNAEILLQIGMVGYRQHQFTDDRGPGIDPVIARNSHYRVNALGPGANIVLPERKTSFMVRFFKEFANVSTVQGQSLQFYTAITF